MRVTPNVDRKRVWLKSLVIGVCLSQSEAMSGGLHQAPLCALVRVLNMLDFDDVLNCSIVNRLLLHEVSAEVTQIFIPPGGRMDINSVRTVRSKDPI